MEVVLPSADDSKIVLSYNSNLYILTNGINTVEIDAGGNATYSSNPV
jgi:hypothetical protein